MSKGGVRGKQLKLETISLTYIDVGHLAQPPRHPPGGLGQLPPRGQKGVGRLFLALFFFFARRYITTQRRNQLLPHLIPSSAVLAQEIKEPRQPHPLLLRALSRRPWRGEGRGGGRRVRRGRDLSLLSVLQLLLLLLILLQLVLKFPLQLLLPLLVLLKDVLEAFVRLLLAAHRRQSQQGQQQRGEEGEPHLVLHLVPRSLSLSASCVYISPICLHRWPCTSRVPSSLHRNRGSTAGKKRRSRRGCLRFLMGGFLIRKTG